MSTSSPPWTESVYRFDLPEPSPDAVARIAGPVFRRVWRQTLNEPGFAVIRFGWPVGSQELRRSMLDLATAMPVQFVPERLGRFDQQVTSRFHRDGVPAASFLLLGYESTTVRSRLFVADAHRAAHAVGLDITEYLAEFNPMYPDGEARLQPFVTELAVPHGEPYIVAINNSLLPHEVSGTNPLGVLHKAEVPHPDPTARRVIDSVGLMLAGDPTGTPKDRPAIRHFLMREDLD